MNKRNHSLHLLALRLSIQTSVTDPSALVCKVWPTPSSSCGTHLRVLRPGTSTRKFLRPSTLPASLHPVSWPSGMDHMIPTRDHLLARGWVLTTCFGLAALRSSSSLHSSHSLPPFNSHHILQILQFDMWGVTPSDLWDWAQLKADIARWEQILHFGW